MEEANGGFKAARMGDIPTYFDDLQQINLLSEGGG